MTAGKALTFRPAARYTGLQSGLKGGGRYGQAGGAGGAGRARAGRYISGQELAAQLGVSRTAIWKAVAALRSDGIPIEAVTNRGYTLSTDVDVLNAAAVAALLHEAPLQALQIEVVDRLPGTNSRPARPCRRRCARGAGADRAGAELRGADAAGTAFIRRPGGLYLSVLLRPEIGARQAVGLTAMAAVAAARAAEKLCGTPIRDQMGQRPVEERQKGLRHPDRGRAESGIRDAGLRRAGAGLQRHGPGRGLA